MIKMFNDVNKLNLFLDANPEITQYQMVTVGANVKLIYKDPNAKKPFEWKGGYRR